MLTAAIETSTVAVSVALADHEGLVARFDAPRVRRHAETVLPSLEAVLALAGRTRGEITQMCVDVGPGMFTGLRVGVTTAITLGMAMDIPVVSVGSLELLVWRLALDGAFQGTVAAVLDARRQECFTQVFSVTAGEAPVALTPAAAMTPAATAELLRRYQCHAAVGDGAVVYPNAFASVASLAPRYPEAATAALVAVRLAHTALRADGVELCYLREPDAEIPKDLRR